ncbi:MAG: NAD-dependent epimerase/dehydratase family protein [Acidobacteria bacterium]|nr:NAD-dependent epimerase/dehydratase family protein [Acidobacteriota bacterium]
MKTLIIGGTQFIGRHLVASLLKGGHDVTILHRRHSHDLGKKVANLQADRNDPAAVQAAVNGKSFDAVFDLAYDWERGTPAKAVSSLAHYLTGNIGRYIYMSSVAAYGDGLNHHEGDALAADDHPDAYVRNKAQTERALFRLHQRHGTPVVTIRPPFVYGPGNPIYREQFFWDRIRDKRALILPGDGRRLMQFVFVKDLVSACIRAVDAPNALGHAFNISNARPLTQAELIDAFFTSCGKTTPVVRIPRERILRCGGHPMGPNLYFGMYFDLPPITMVISKAQRVLTFKPTPFADGLKETYKWYVRNHKRTMDYGFEDHLLAKDRAQLAS